MGTTAIFAQAATDIMTQADTWATYTPSTGYPVTLRVKLSSVTNMQPDGFTTQTWPTMTILECLPSAAGKEPNRGETFTVGTTVYTVESVLENDGIFCKLAVVSG